MWHIFVSAGNYGSKMAGLQAPSSISWNNCKKTLWTMQWQFSGIRINVSQIGSHNAKAYTTHHWGNPWPLSWSLSKKKLIPIMVFQAEENLLRVTWKQKINYSSQYIWPHSPEENTPCWHSPSWWQKDSVSILQIIMRFLKTIMTWERMGGPVSMFIEKETPLAPTTSSNREPIRD